MTEITNKQNLTVSKQFLRAADVALYMDISVQAAYKVIRKLNDELNENGYITISGRVSKAYFEKKVYGTEVNNVSI